MEQFACSRQGCQCGSARWTVTQALLLAAPIVKPVSCSLDGMADLGRILMLIGGLLLVIGLVLIFAGKLNLPIGRLPGDVIYRGKHTTFYFPLVTCIVISVILSLVLYLVNRMR